MLGLLILFGIALAILIALLTAMLAWEMVHPPRHTIGWAVARKLAVDPGELGLPFEEWWFDRPDGARLAVWEICPGPRIETQNPTGSPGLTAVFVHGWGHSRIDSLQRIEPFLALVDRIVLYDVRGHGQSTGTSRLGDGEGDDLLALMERLGDGPCMLVGHSMGAVIAMAAAARVKRSGQVVGVIAYGPYCEFHRSLQGRLRVNGLPTRPLTDLALFVHRLRGLTPLSLEPEQLKEITCPVLIIHGVDDQVSPLAHAQRIASGLRDAVIVQVEDAAHADTHRIDKERHDSEVRKFLQHAQLRFGCTPDQHSA